MYDYSEDYDESMYEQTPLDELFLEYREKCKDILLGSVQGEIDAIKKENVKLNNLKDELCKKKNDLDNRERLLQRKEDDYKKEFEKEFYNKTIIENIEDLVKNMTLYYISYELFDKDKCEFCDEDRMLTLRWKDGTEENKKCSCSKGYYKYVTFESEINTVQFNQRKGDYKRPSYFELTKSHKQDMKDSTDYDYSYEKFNIYYIRDNFNDETRILHDNKGFGKKIGFRSEEECQKYCDWLNE